MSHFLSLLAVVLGLFAGNANAAATEFQYLCHSYYHNGDSHAHSTLKLTVNKTEAHGDIVEESWDLEIGGTLNPKYRSKGDVRFLKFGYNLIVEDVLVSGGKELRDHSMGGFARVEGEAEGGFYQFKFICKRS